MATGTLRRGLLRPEASVDLLPAGTPVRIRGLQVHGRAVGAAEPGQRVAVNLHGVELNVTEFLEEQKLGQFYGLEHVAIDTDNFAGEVANIKSAGIKILEERVLPDGRKVCFFEGPEGVRLEFLEWK